VDSSEETIMAKALVIRRDEGSSVEGVAWMFKATGGQTDGRFDFMVGDVGYLSGPPLHLHKEQDDTFYVLGGVLTLQVGDNVFDLMPGDFATVPPGVAHTFDNIRADQPSAQVINLMTPGGLYAFFADRARLGSEVGAATIEELATRHGVELIGPPLRMKLGLV
jgi:quercetin dioxygenase-like cupin family protein